MKERVYVLAIVLAGVLLMTLSLAATTGSRQDRDFLSSVHADANRAGRSYSGDDAYDPAAGATLGGSLAAVTGRFSGDDAYDPAAGGYPE